MCERCVQGRNQIQGNQESYRHRSEGRVQGLADVQGKWVKINRGGPDSLTGKVEAVRSDYIVLDTDNGRTYVADSHIKSISELANKSGGNRSKGDANRTRGNQSQGQMGAGANAYPSTFNGVVQSFDQKFVQINSGGPEMVNGFVAGVDNNNVKLVNNREVSIIPLSHIRAIKAENNNKNNKSGGNKSGSNQNKNKSGSKNN